MKVDARSVRVTLEISLFHSLTSGQNVKSPYSYPGRKILKVRFQQQCDRDRSVDICAFGGDGVAGEGGSGVPWQEWNERSPFPCTSNVEVWRAWDGTHTWSVVGTPEHMVATNVEMVADEVSCWLPNNSKRQRRPAVTSLIAQHAMFEIRVSSRGTCFASKRILR